MPDIGKVLRGDPEALRCPFPHYKEAQDAGGVVYDPDSDTYIVTDHSLIASVTARPNLFSNQNPMGPLVVEAVSAVKRMLKDADPEFVDRVGILMSKGAVLFTADPPEHTRHRRLLNRALMRRAVTELEPTIRQIFARLIDDFIGDGTADLVDAYARPGSVFAMATVLGVAPERARDFSRWAEAANAAIGHALTDDEVRDTMSTQLEFLEFLEAEFADRIAHPRNDLFTTIVLAREEGETPLTIDESVGLAAQLVAAGADTTAKLIGTALYWLVSRPEGMAQVRESPALIPAYIEETLRLDGPAQGLYRLTTEDTELGGMRIPANKYVYIVYGAANRDPSVFDHPDEWDLDRDGRATFAFGRGPHTCIGAPLARSVARIALESLLSRLDDIALVPPAAPPDQDLSSYSLRGLKTLQVTFRAIVT